jgi:hypothetical protein
MAQADHQPQRSAQAPRTDSLLETEFMPEEKLVLYEQMRLAIQRCAEIDEAAAIRDKGAQLEAYARIRNDDASERKFAEIRLRAVRKIGELSRELPRPIV